MSNCTEEQLEKIGYKLAEAWNCGEIERHDRLVRKVYKSGLTDKGINYVLKVYRNALK